MLTTSVPKGIKLEAFARVDNVVVIKLQDNCKFRNHKITTRFIVVILQCCHYTLLSGLTTTCVDKLVVILTTTVVVLWDPVTQRTSGVLRGMLECSSY